MLDPDVRRVLDGTPHSAPVWIGTHGDHVAILTGPGSRKARNLRRDPRVALSLTPAGRSSTGSRRSTPVAPTPVPRSGSSRSSNPTGRAWADARRSGHHWTPAWRVIALAGVQPPIPFGRTGGSSGTAQSVVQGRPLRVNAVGGGLVPV